MDRDKVKHEGKGSGQAEEGLKEHETTEDSSGGCFKSNRMTSSNAVPRTTGEGPLDWGKVNHDGWSEK